MVSNHEGRLYHRLSFLAAALVLFLLFLLPACSLDDSSPNLCTIDYWVAMDGSDYASGDMDDPFLTIEHAREVIRASNDRGICTINVYIKGGTYRVNGPLMSDAGDSGAPTNMTFLNNAKVSSSDEVPAWILESAGRGGRGF